MKTKENMSLNEFLGLVKNEIIRVAPAESNIFSIEWR